MAIPVLGRLSLADYRRMLLTSLIMLVEEILRFLLAIWNFFKLPFNTTTIFKYSKAFHVFLPRFLFNRWKETTDPDYQAKTVHPITVFQHISEMAKYWGYGFEEYAVKTEDGYWLGVHRLLPGQVNGDESDQQKPVVLLWHGFMMNSEVWMAHPSGSTGNLAMFLVDNGYDVWMGNVRGNKYSHKHSKLKPSDNEFWDFSLDEHALIDLPTTVDYILKKASVSSLSYVGFSQGTTICFMAMSLLPDIRRKINFFTALAPSMTPYGLINPFIASLAKTAPEFLYLVFGRRSLLPSVYFYQSILPPALFSSVIDTAVSVLFHWKGQNMSLKTKSVTYQHLYSLCSVKLMVHWFQLIKDGRFQMYNDTGKSVKPALQKDSLLSDAIKDPNGPDSDGIVLQDASEMLVGLSPATVRIRKTSSATASVQIPVPHYIASEFPVRYPTEQLKYKNNDGVPIALFYGGSDGLLDMHALLKGLRFSWDKISKKLSAFLKNQTKDKGFVLYDLGKDENKKDSSSLVYLKCIPAYEHLCFLWADNLNVEVFQDIKSLLEKYNRQ